jgi:hypothetical protein
MLLKFNQLLRVNPYPRKGPSYSVEMILTEYVDAVPDPERGMRFIKPVPLVYEVRHVFLPKDLTHLVGVTSQADKAFLIDRQLTYMEQAINIYKGMRH